MQIKFTDWWHDILYIIPRTALLSLGYGYLMNKGENRVAVLISPCFILILVRIYLSFLSSAVWQLFFMVLVDYCTKRAMIVMLNVYHVMTWKRSLRMKKDHDHDGDDVDTIALLLLYYFPDIYYYNCRLDFQSVFVCFFMFFLEQTDISTLLPSKVL